MTYVSTLADLYALEKKGMNYTLGRVKRALARLGNPQESGHFVHVAGTNGKGSVCAMVEAGLRHAGYRTGLYTSPHLHQCRERIQINREPISEKAFAERVRAIRSALPFRQAADLSFFEFMTLLAFVTFRDEKCDVAVIEVGLGGRLDATNLLRPDVSVITGISLDHMHVLGNTLGKIAREKAGIIKPKVPVVSGVTQPEAQRSVERAVKRAETTLRQFDEAFRVESSGTKVTVVRGADRVGPIQPSLPGAHQRKNIAVATETLFALRERGFKIRKADIEYAIARTKWAARLEWARGTPRFLFDAAHNPEGILALRDYLATRRKTGRRAVIFGVMRDKDFYSMLEVIELMGDRLFFAAPNMSRALPAKELALIANGVATKSPEDAVARAKKFVGPDGEVVVAGSIYLVSEIRAMVKKLRHDPQIPL